MTTGTAEQIHTLAEKVMGWNGSPNSKPIPYQLYWRLKGNWNPFTTAAHTEMLMDRMRELGYKYLIEDDRLDGLIECRWAKREKNLATTFSIGHADNWRTAVCVAAIEAINAALPEER